MQILIIGAGEVGFHTALRLSREGHNVIVIDRDPERIRKINEQMDVQTVVGQGSSPSVLADAGISDSDLLVAVTDMDDVNLQACRFAGILAPSTTKIARIRSEDILKFMEQNGNRTLDVDTVINPEREVARQILQFISVPEASSVTDFADGRVKLLGLKIPVTSPLVGKSMAEMHSPAAPKFLVAAIERSGQVVIPRGEDVFLADDLAYVVTLADATGLVMEYLGLYSSPARNLVCGGRGAPLAARWPPGAGPWT